MTQDRFAETMLRGIFGGDEKSSIKDSLFAKHVLSLYLKDSNSFGQEIFGIGNSRLNDEDADDMISRYKSLPNRDEVKDFRISKILMHGIRGVRKHGDDDFFGLDFECNNKVCSSVIIGSNGIGKTSFYSALELVGMEYSNCIWTTWCLPNGGQISSTLSTIQNFTMPNSIPTSRSAYFSSERGKGER